MFGRGCPTTRVRVRVILVLGALLHIASLCTLLLLCHPHYGQSFCFTRGRIIFNSYRLIKRSSLVVVSQVSRMERYVTSFGKAYHHTCSHGWLSCLSGVTNTQLV